jgi:hypothetical protein
VVTRFAVSDPIITEEIVPKAIALSRNARALITRRLAGEEVELTDENRGAYERLAVAGFTEPGSTRLTAEARRRQREFLPHDGSLSAEAIDLLRKYLAGDCEVNDTNRAAYRELAAAGVMIAGHSFVGGDESVYRFTEEGWMRRFELAGVRPTVPSHAESA